MCNFEVHAKCKFPQFRISIFSNSLLPLHSSFLAPARSPSADKAKRPGHRCSGPGDFAESSGDRARDWRSCDSARCCLRTRHVDGLKPLRALLDLELDDLILEQTTASLPGDL